MHSRSFTDSHLPSPSVPHFCLSVHPLPASHSPINHPSRKHHLPTTDQTPCTSSSCLRAFQPLLPSALTPPSTQVSLTNVHPLVPIHNPLTQQTVVSEEDTHSRDTQAKCSPGSEPFLTQTHSSLVTLHAALHTTIFKTHHTLLYTHPPCSLTDGQVILIHRGQLAMRSQARALCVPPSCSFCHRHSNCWV